MQRKKQGSPPRKCKRKFSYKISDRRKIRRRPESGKKVPATPENAGDPSKHTTSQQKRQRRPRSGKRREVSTIRRADSSDLPSAKMIPAATEETSQLTPPTTTLPDTTKGATHQNQVQPEEKIGKREKKRQPKGIDGSRWFPSGPSMVAQNTLQEALYFKPRPFGRERATCRNLLILSYSRLV